VQKRNVEASVIETNCNREFRSFEIPKSPKHLTSPMYKPKLDGEPRFCEIEIEHEEVINLTNGHLNDLVLIVPIWVRRSDPVQAEAGQKPST
jgi:hypothetical protein